MESKKIALITGVNGMDGSHLADLLLSKGYIVYGMERRSSVKNRTNTKHLEDNPDFHFVIGDMSDSESLRTILFECEPDEIYNLAAQSFVGSSWKIPLETSDTNGVGVLRILNATKQYQDNRGKRVKFYQASTSEMFGKMVENPANENTPFYPRSPYGIAKLYAYWMVRNYRESYGMFACNGILFNHESERRGIEFVTRKITDGVARIHLGLQDKISLGNLEVWRDWGYAPDYVEGMWLMLQQDNPDDYVLATNHAHSLEELLDCAFKVVGLEWRDYIEQDERYMRPAEVPYLKGDASKAQEQLGWKPKTSFESIVKIMVENDILLLGNN
ncbi:MAG: GDP-mannose 4,6-dehydratase [Flavobacteriaceae bacterium]|jgi:GDPmannose 4,6-dehydratase|nr:GDP-mannose 4,6-dehydratase [Flavobacteriaceae bacterium]